jgi:hypothetical protein
MSSSNQLFYYGHREILAAHLRACIELDEGRVQQAARLLCHTKLLITSNLLGGRSSV